MQVESSGQTGQIELPENLKNSTRPRQANKQRNRNISAQFTDSDFGGNNGKSRENQIGGCTKKNNAQPRKYGQLRILIVHRTWYERKGNRRLVRNTLKVRFILRFDIFARLHSEIADPFSGKFMHSVCIFKASTILI